MDKDFVNSIYVKKQEFNDGGFILKITAYVDDLAKELDSHIKYYNDKKVVNFDIKFGKDSGKPYAEWDNWEPQSQSTQENQDNDLPF